MFCKKSVVAYIFFLVAAAAAAQAPGSQRDRVPSIQQHHPELNAIVQRMEQAAQENRQNYRAYVITRGYRLFGGEQPKPGSEVVAEVSFVPPKSKEFKILESKGSSRGETVVRHVLQNEQKDAQSGRAPGAVTRENYDFTLLGEQLLDGHNCYVLGLQPKRKETNLILGRAWVDENTYLVRRIQGQMTKMPSWWIKSVAVTLDFSEAGGMWLQTHTRATADVRIFGPHTYAEDALKIRTGSTVAEVIPPTTKRARRPYRNPEVVLGTLEH